MSKKTVSMVLAGLFAALGVLMPVLFHLLGISAMVFLPMHIPVLLCGLICGWGWGLAVGFVTPFLSGLLTGMPPLYPIGAYMAFELAAYGFCAGFLAKKVHVIIALIAAMAAGRIVLGIAQAVFLGFTGNFAFKAYLSGAFVTPLPGIAVQLVIIPVLILALKKARILKD